MTQKDLRIGSILEDSNGNHHTVVRFDGCFTITKYDVNRKGEIWHVDEHLKHHKLVKY